MELKYLNTVKMILETGSFQEAARRLHYTQSTVTFQVQQLEKELNVKLFEKLGRRMALTQAGREVLPYMDGVLDAAAALLDYGKRETELKGTLTVGFLESLLIYKTPRILREFRKKAPDVQLSLRIANCYEIVAAIASGAVDAGLHYNVTKQSPSVVTEPLAPQPPALVASPELSEKERDFISPGQTKETALIYREEMSVFSRVFNEYLLRRNIKVKRLCRCRVSKRLSCASQAISAWLSCRAARWRTSCGTGGLSSLILRLRAVPSVRCSHIIRING